MSITTWLRNRRRAPLVIVPPESKVRRGVCRPVPHPSDAGKGFALFFIGIVIGSTITALVFSYIAVWR